MPRKNQTKHKQLTNYISIVLDASSSMSYLRSKTVAALNKTIDEIKENAKRWNQKTYVSLVIFSDWNNIKFNFKNKPVEELNHVPLDMYHPYGNTALNDAVAVASNLMGDRANYNDKNVSYLVIALTDGQENDSKEYTRYNGKLRLLMQTLQATDRWTFTFSVPRGQKDNVASTLGIPSDNIQEWDQTEIGTETAWQSTSAGLGNYYAARNRGLTGVMNFYSADLTGVTTKQLKKQLVDVSHRFRLLDVNKEVQIRDLVESKTGKVYKKGCAFYQLTKPETVQEYKEIAIKEKGKTAMYTGEDARNILGLPIGQRCKVSVGNLANYEVYIASTSVNRKLVRGTKVAVLVDALA